MHQLPKRNEAEQCKNSSSDEEGWIKLILERTGAPGNFDDWLTLLRGKLQLLSHSKHLAFGASCCERSIPNYRAFSREEHWGDPQILKQALDLVWRHVASENPAELKLALQLNLKALEAVTPDTENFKSPLTSAALDAASSIAEALACALDGTLDHVLTISSLSRDTIDLYLQRKNDVNYADPEFESNIAHDPLMFAELAKQQLDLHTLEAAHNPMIRFWISFRQAATLGGKSNLGISF